jgi:hypothetical protein
MMSIAKCKFTVCREERRWACFYVEWHLLPNDDDDVIQIHFQLKFKEAKISRIRRMGQVFWELFLHE